MPTSLATYLGSKAFSPSTRRYSCTGPLIYMAAVDIMVDTYATCILYYSRGNSVKGNEYHEQRVPIMIV